MTQNRKKIIYLLTQSEWGGAQKYAYDLATNLNPEEYSIAVAAGEGDGELFDRLKTRNIRTIRLNHLVRNINLWQEVLGFFELLRLFRDEKPDIIHLNSSKMGVLGSVCACLAKNLYGLKNLKTVYTAHGWVFNEPLPPYLKSFYLALERFSSRWKDKIIAVSNYDYRQAIEHDLAPAKKLSCITNQLNANNLNLLERNQSREILFKKIGPQSSQSLNESIIVGTIANLYPTKGLAFLIESAGEICRDNGKVIFMLIGFGQLEKELNNQVRQSNLENKFFLLGEIKNASELLKAFDLFVLPSVKEGLPYAVLEARAAGLPVIATRVGGLPEILSEQSLVAAGDAKALALKIQDALSDPRKYLSAVNLTANKFTDFLDKTYSVYRS